MTEASALCPYVDTGQLWEWMGGVGIKQWREGLVGGDKGVGLGERMNHKYTRWIYVHTCIEIAHVLDR